MTRNWAWWVATVGGVGCSPVAPGTAGSLAGLVLVLVFNSLTRPWSPPAGAIATGAVILVFTLVSVASSSAVARDVGARDPSIVVVDEVCGMLVTFAGLPLTGVTVVGGFVFFRLFDIVKPFPISWIERRGVGGWGIVGDDLASGVAANLCVRLLLGLMT